MTYPRSPEECQALLREIREAPGYRAPLLFGIGRAEHRTWGILSVSFPFVSTPYGSADLAAVLIRYFDIKTEGVVVLWPTTEELWDGIPYLRFLKSQEESGLVVYERAAIDLNRQEAKTICLVFLFEDLPIQGLPDARLKLEAVRLGFLEKHDINLTDLAKHLR